MTWSITPFGQLRPVRLVALLVVTVLLALVACGDGPDQDAATTNTTSTTGSTTTTPAEPDDLDARPERWVGIDETGRLVTVGADGEVARVLVELDHPEECPAPGEPVAGCSWVTELAVSPDGDDVYYEVCCEPAPGTIHRVSIAGGEPEMVAHGAHPAIDGAGERLAAVELQWVTVHRLADAEQLGRFEATGDAPAALHGMAWSPDGERLAFTVFEETDRPATVHVLDVGSAASLDDARAVGAPAGGGSWTHPAFRGDGLLAVVEQDLQLPNEATGAARVLLVDPDTGAVVESFDPGGSVRSLRYDASGRHLIYVTGDGAVHWRGADGDEVALDDGGYLAAAW